MKDNDIEFTDTSHLKVVYVQFVGTDSDGYNVYQFLITENADDVWGEEWNEKPACNCRYLLPEEDMYDYVKELKTEIKLDLAQNNCCMSMQDIRDHCSALAYENLDEAEEYPENGRIVIQFGDSLDDVEVMLAKRDLHMRYV